MMAGCYSKIVSYLILITVTTSSVVYSFSILSDRNDLSDEKHGVMMGKPSHTCDDGETRLDVDWDGSPVNYTCFTPKEPIPVQDVQTIQKCYHVPSDYVPQHHCMDKVIKYNESIPTFGDHRPLWPIYGEYNFVPIQRWLHNIEHGAIVMLYDPCTHPAMVKKLRKLVTSCLKRYIITKSSQLSRERPLALVAWGCRLSMNYVDEKRVISFIRNHALKGPEGKVSQDGQYKLGLVRQAETVIGSDEYDINICP